jgi:hypothetical protein
MFSGTSAKIRADFCHFDKVLWVCGIFTLSIGEQGSHLKKLLKRGDLSRQVAPKPELKKLLKRGGLKILDF